MNREHDIDYIKSRIRIMELSIDKKLDQMDSIRQKIENIREILAELKEDLFRLNNPFWFVFDWWNKILYFTDYLDRPYISSEAIDKTIDDILDFYKRKPKTFNSKDDAEYHKVSNEFLAKVLLLSMR